MGDQSPATIPCGRFEWERIIREDFALSTKLKAVAFVFATHARTAEGDRIFPGNDQLARGASMSLATFKRHRDELVNRGLLTKVRQGNRHQKLADEWRLSMPDLCAPATLPEQQPPAPIDTNRDPAVFTVDRENIGGLSTPYARAQRKVDDALAGLTVGSAEYSAARVELAHELDHRVTPVEARRLLGYSETEYRAVMKRGRSA